MLNNGQYVLYVKEGGRGIAVMEFVDDMDEVELYEPKKCLNLIVMKGNNLPFSCINTPTLEQQACISQIGEPFSYSVDEAGVVFPSQSKEDVQ